jgi:hypothetical protein
MTSLWNRHLEHLSGAFPRKHPSINTTNATPSFHSLQNRFSDLGLYAYTTRAVVWDNMFLTCCCKKQEPIRNHWEALHEDMRILSQEVAKRGEARRHEQSNWNNWMEWERVANKPTNHDWWWMKYVIAPFTSRVRRSGTQGFGVENPSAWGEEHRSLEWGIPRAPDARKERGANQHERLTRSLGLDYLQGCPGTWLA